MTASSELMVDITEINFAEVIGRSSQLPVLVDFWADWCAPCKQLAPVLEKMARELQGRLLVARVNADSEPVVTQQFGVRGLPTLKLVFQGQLVAELVGAQTEAAIRKMLAPFLAGNEPDSAGEQPPDFHAEVLAALQAGHLEDAMAVLRAQLAEAPDDHRSREMLVETLIQENRLAEAEDVLASAPVVTALVRVRALLAFSLRAADMPPLHQLEALVEASPDRHACYQLAVRLIAANRMEAGMDLLLQIIRSDRQYGDDAARRTLLEVFDMLGREDALTVLYRRRMASILL